jgi:predicted transcriptional regulator YdeE
MSYVINKLDLIKIVGIEVRTTNENRQAEKDIAVLWGRFFSEGVLQQIPHRLSDDIFVLYPDYEGDFTRPYTCVIGCQVTQIANIPKHLTLKEIPKSIYAVIPAEGQYPESLIQAWQTVWTSDLERAYTTDFESYPAGFDFKGKDLFNVYIALKINDHSEGPRK